MSVQEKPVVESFQPPRARTTGGGPWNAGHTFEFRAVVPYETLLSERIVRNPSTWVMLVFGFAPLLGFYLAASMFQLFAWLLTYFALVWTAYFYVAVTRRSGDLRIGLAIALFTGFIGCQLDIWVRSVPPVSLLYALAATHQGITSVTAYIAGVGLNEEFFKSLPVMLVAFRFRRDTKPLDGLFFGAMSGLGFAVREGFKYMGNAADTSDALHQALIRTTTTPFLHATWAGIAGYFIGVAAVRKHRPALLTLVGVGVAATLHGSYDFLDTRVTAVGVAALAYLLFVAYLDRSQAMARELGSPLATREAAAALLKETVVRLP